jgi:hypothetical protein
MVAPGLRQDFNLGVGVGPATLEFVGADHFHLRERRIPRTLLRKRHKFFIAQAGERDDANRIGAARGTQGRHGLTRLAHAFHDLVVKEARRG